VTGRHAASGRDPFDPVKAARDYLAAEPLVDLTTMPRPVLERVAAELRRHLAAVLAVKGR
jgi:hypothetical protein